MSEYDIEDTLSADENPGAATGGRSTADRIQARRRQRRAEGGRVLRLQTPDGDVVVVYKPLRLKNIRNAASGKNGASGTNIELLLAACKHIEFRDPDTGERVPAAADTDNPELPVRFDGRLADLLDLKGNTPREILIDLFEGEDRPILGHARRLDEWSSGEELDAADDVEIEDLLGEASAET